MKVANRWCLARIPEGQEELQLIRGIRYETMEQAFDESKKLPSSFTEGFTYVLEIKAVCAYGEIVSAKGDV
jgi:hypothetical protein